VAWHCAQQQACHAAISVDFRLRDYLTAWSNLALTNLSGSPRLQTTDLILTYGRDWKKLKIESTLEAYLNRRPVDIDERNTMESSLKLSYPIGRFRVFTIQSFDILTYKGSYFGEAGLGYERRVAKKTELAVSFTRDGPLRNSMLST